MEGVKELNLKKNTINGFLWMLSGSGIQSIMQFVVLIVLARLLDPESFGIVSSALVVISFTVILSTLGFGPALVQKKVINNRQIGTSYTVSIVMAVFFGIIIYIIAPLISNFFHSVELILILRIMVVIFLFQGLSIVSESLIQREMMFRVIVRIQVISYVTYGIIGIILAVFGLGVWSLVFAYMSQIIIKSLLSLYLQPYKINFGFDYRSFKELLYFSFGYSLAKISAEISSQGDNFIIGRFLGPEALGFYSRAYQMMVMPANLIGKIFEKVLFPAMSKIQDNHKKLANVYIDGICATTTLILPASVFLIINAERIILLLFGEQWLGLIDPFKVLAVALLFRSSYKISDSLVKAKGAVYHRAIRKWIYAFLIVLGAYLGQLNAELVGVAFGISIAILINYTLMAQLVLKLINIKMSRFIASHIGGGIIAISFWLVSIPFEKYVLISWNNNVLELLIFIIVYIVIFTLFLFLKPSLFIGKEGAVIINKLKSKVFYKKLIR